VEQQSSNKLGGDMSELEAQEVQPVIITIDGADYDMNEQSNASKEHYVEVVNLRREIADLQNQIATAQRRAINLQVALGFRENALKESIKVVEDEVEEVVN
jgi:predicted  nucleic acid-binding Zn-ribbon protein